MVEYICGPHSFVGGIYVDSQREMKVEILSGPSDKRKEKKRLNKFLLINEFQSRLEEQKNKL